MTWCTCTRPGSCARTTTSSTPMAHRRYSTGDLFRHHQQGRAGPRWHADGGRRPGPGLRRALRDRGRGRVREAARLDTAAPRGDGALDRFPTATGCHRLHPASAERRGARGSRRHHRLHRCGLPAGSRMAGSAPQSSCGRRERRRGYRPRHIRFRPLRTRGPAGEYRPVPRRILHHQPGLPARGVRCGRRLRRGLRLRLRCGLQLAPDRRRVPDTQRSRLGRPARLGHAAPPATPFLSLRQGAGPAVPQAPARAHARPPHRPHGGGVSGVPPRAAADPGVSPLSCPAPHPGLAEPLARGGQRAHRPPELRSGRPERNHLPVRVLVFPRDDVNPYQRLLYGEMGRLGARVTYLGRLTPSHTLNLLLLPAELAARRAAGARLVHLHWVFDFSLPGSSRWTPLRQLAQIWFVLWLRTVRLLGIRLVWTAHNVLPHGRVFADDVSARRSLVRASDLVFAHSPAVLAELAALGATARRSVVIPHGPFGPAVPGMPLRVPGHGGQVRQLLFFGKVEEYKGVEELLAAMATMPAGLPARLTIAGQCEDPALRSRLCALARATGGRAVLRLEHVPEDEVTGLLAASDVVVLPFRTITTSGSAMLA